jgi:hypothetical protein
MAKFKPDWQKTNIPKPIKIELFKVMMDNPTQTAREQAVARLELGQENDRWLKTSRDTFKKLTQELLEMPLIELDTLPENLRATIKEKRKSVIPISNTAKIPVVSAATQDSMAIEKDPAIIHTNELVIAAKRLVENLAPYSLWTWDITLLDAILDNEEPDSDIQQQLQFDYPTKHLFIHMQQELPILEKLEGWDDLKINDVKQVRDKLNLRASQRKFPGKCEVCKDFKDK